MYRDKREFIIALVREVEAAANNDFKTIYLITKELTSDCEPLDRPFWGSSLIVDMLTRTSP